MQKSLKAIVSVVLLGAALLLTGCKDKGEAFIGHWMTTEAHPSELTITFDDGMYHVDYKWWGPGGYAMQYYNDKLEAKAESESVLMTQGLGSKPLRLEKNVLSFHQRDYKKIN